MWIDGRTTTVFWLFVVLGGVVDGSGSKCRVANLFSSVLVFSLGGILGWPIGNGREESIDDCTICSNGFGRSGGRDSIVFNNFMICL